MTHSPPAIPTQTAEPRFITKLGLQQFRSYPQQNWQFEPKNVVITGSNGAGKTNILEAISLFVPGRGLRRANPASLPHKKGKTTDGVWAVSMSIEGSFLPLQMGTGVERNSAGQKSRVVHIDGEIVPSIAECAQHIAIVWLTPDMDRLLRDTPAERRKFLDRLTLSLFPNHAAAVQKYEKLTQSRLRVLGDYAPDAAWLYAIEREMAAAAVHVYENRARMIQLIQEQLTIHKNDYAPLPSAQVWLESEYDSFMQDTAVEGREAFTLELLTQHRAKDAKAGRTHIGPHSSDVCVLHEQKHCLAQDASTGEQKALLLRLILAHIQVLAAKLQFQPIVLLDEVCAHLDPKRRAATLEALSDLRVQTWLTGTEPMLYNAWDGKAQFVEL